MQDDYVSLFEFNRWANTRMLDACRKLTFEQCAAAPFPGWFSVRFTVWHIAVVTEVWGRMLADDPDRSFLTEADVAMVDEAAHLLERASRAFDSILPKLTPEQLTTPRTFLGPNWTAVLPPWVVLRHVVNHTTYHRGPATQTARPLMALALEDATTTAVVACAHARNAASLRVLEKLGLKRVGEVMLPDTSEPAVKLARDKSV